MEIKCELVRGPVYLTGEDLECWINIKNNSDKAETLAWVSVQLNCFCTVSDDKVTNLESSRSRKISLENHNSNKTSFLPTQGETGMAVLSLKTKVLVCSLELAPNESKKIFFTENIPHNAPPSFRGHSVKYSYKLCIGSQKLGENTTLQRLPIRVLSVDTYIPNMVKVEEKLGPSNPFLEETVVKDPLVDVIMQTVQEVTSRKSASFFVIANSRGKVCKFCLFKKNFRLGEDIIGTFDFTVGEIDCVQYSVSLQSVESVNKDFRVKEDQSDKVINQSKQHEVCLGFTQSNIVLPIPLHLTPSFSTNICSLTYNLHFEFVTSVNELTRQGPPEEEGGSEWQGPTKMDIETMVWDLPITLYPTFPTHAALHSNIGTSNTSQI
eukprot:TRINITY_DN15972_c0_g1_i1.p1 TRINITY_DN15972_c0_g1~~TRINITY_DN15972_c0_g1_i1.p1  ORF type:complete len:380 (-),score=61.83 TRINITY_DN15972_c0_g1_i1:340-1479(-)